MVECHSIKTTKCFAYRTCSSLWQFCWTNRFLNVLNAAFVSGSPGSTTRSKLIPGGPMKRRRQAKFWPMRTQLNESIANIRISKHFEQILDFCTRVFKPLQFQRNKMALYMNINVKCFFWCSVEQIAINLYSPTRPYLFKYAPPRRVLHFWQRAPLGMVMQKVAHIGPSSVNSHTEEGWDSLAEFCTPSQNHLGPWWRVQARFSNMGSMSIPEDIRFQSWKFAKSESLYSKLNWCKVQIEAQIWA